jgi:hypothetical protein
MITRERIGEAFEATDLDELVHDTKGEEAANINNGGIDAQIDYLLESGWSLESIWDALNNMDNPEG